MAGQWKLAADQLHMMLGTWQGRCRQSTEVGTEKDIKNDHSSELKSNHNTFGRVDTAANNATGPVVGGDIWLH